MKVATGWFDEAVKGESVQRLLAMSDLPFALDWGDEMLTTTGELEELFQLIFTNRIGKPKKVTYTAAFKEYRCEVLPPCIPVSIAVVELHLTEGGRSSIMSIAVSVKNGTYKVVGFDERAIDE